ncbi:hypothetical protein EMIT0P218_510001 [Pseudomonas sp. IT-P218]
MAANIVSVTFFILIIDASRMLECL